MEEDEPTRWQIVAFAKRNGKTNKDYLAFRLISHNRATPRGTFNFETLTKGLLCGRQVSTRFKSLPLDAAYHWSTCVRHHPPKDLTMCVRIRVVGVEGGGEAENSGLPRYEDLLIPDTVCPCVNSSTEQTS